MPNNRHRRDDNHQQIVQGLRKLGYEVIDLSQLNSGCGDILVGKARQTNWLFEIKVPGREALTDQETRFRSTWTGQYAIITSLAEAIYVMTKGKAEGVRTALSWKNLAKPCFNYQAAGSQCVYVDEPRQCGTCPFRSEDSIAIYLANRAKKVETTKNSNPKESDHDD